MSTQENHSRSGQHRDVPVRILLEKLATREHKRGSVHPHADGTRAMLKRTKRIRPEDDARTFILSSKDKPGFVEQFVDCNKVRGNVKLVLFFNVIPLCYYPESSSSPLVDYKGSRGVFVTQPVEVGAFVFEYRGKLITAEERLH
ncbi:N-lysine methyltransferase SETD8-A [Labeo rohita]|uniref:N-lysine methyltransferase SETD8-A n=1 Tax=Labeo rohita TaxID=84645 RepID=A0A498MLX9_LABRO|nr:N-lysine methyltransferase SETD8-A [Labeo rohita]